MPLGGPRNSLNEAISCVCPIAYKTSQLKDNHASVHTQRGSPHQVYNTSAYILCDNIVARHLYVAF